MYSAGIRQGGRAEVSWCDKLASVPSVGFMLTRHFAPIDFLLNACAPVLDRADEQQAQNTTIEQAANFSVALATHDGFKYTLNETHVAVAFQHRMKFKATSGGPPIAEMLSRPMPFTSLLEEVAERLVELAPRLPEAKNRRIDRVGIVSTTPLAEEDVPPGIMRLISYMGRPWKGALEHYRFTVTGEIARSATAVDRCVHTVNCPEDKSQLLTLQFDWQRTFSEAWTINHDNMQRILQDARRDALKYFEELAEGSRFDEELIREAARV
jgi:hypothetical protein